MRTALVCILFFPLSAGVVFYMFWSQTIEQNNVYTPMQKECKRSEDIRRKKLETVLQELPIDIMFILSFYATKQSVCVPMQIWVSKLKFSFLDIFQHDWICLLSN